jgi:hypothetical protein
VSSACDCAEIAPRGDLKGILIGRTDEADVVWAREITYLKPFSSTVIPGIGWAESDGFLVRHIEVRGLSKSDGGRLHDPEEHDRERGVKRARVRCLVSAHRDGDHQRYKTDRRECRPHDVRIFPAVTNTRPASLA